MKLPETTIIKLEKLLLEIKHPKLKKIFKRALPNWIKYGVAFQEWGVEGDNSKIIKDPTKDDGCCLLGSSIIGVKDSTPEIFNLSFRLYRPIWSISGISRYEMQKIFGLFDTGISSITYGYLENDQDPLLSKEVLKIRNTILDEESTSEIYKSYKFLQRLYVNCYTDKTKKLIQEESCRIWKLLSPFEQWLSYFK